MEKRLDIVLGLEKKKQVKQVDLMDFGGNEVDILEHGEMIGWIQRHNELVDEVAKFEMDEEALARIIFEKQPYMRYTRQESLNWAKDIISKSSSWIVRKG